MSLFTLPKELRLRIWSHVYHDEDPRLVPIITDERRTKIFPRFVFSIPPIVTQICHEARTEARFQAQKGGHLIKLSAEDGNPAPAPKKDDTSMAVHEVYYRPGKDILYEANIQTDLGIAPATESASGFLHGTLLVSERRSPRSNYPEGGHQHLEATGPQQSWAYLCSDIDSCSQAPMAERLFAECDKRLFTTLAVNVQRDSDHVLRDPATYEDWQTFGEQLKIFTNLRKVYFISQDFEEYEIHEQNEILANLTEVAKGFLLVDDRNTRDAAAALPLFDWDIAALHDGRLEVVAKDYFDTYGVYMELEAWLMFEGSFPEEDDLFP
jgi:hypothetical protein